MDLLDLGMNIINGFAIAITIGMLIMFAQVMRS